MTIPPISQEIAELPAAPSRSQGTTQFNTAAGPFVASLGPMVEQQNAWAEQANTMAAAIDGTIAGINANASAAATSASQAAGYVATFSAPFGTWAALAAATGMAAGWRASVLTTDAGTHSDPVVGGTVANAGVYRYSASPAGWERIGNSDSQAAAAQVATIAGHASTASAAASEAQGYADDADTAKLAAQASLNFRATLAEGIAAFAVGQYFTSTDADGLTAATGTIRTYKRIAGSPYYEDQGDAAAPNSVKYQAPNAVYLTLEQKFKDRGVYPTDFGARGIDSGSDLYGFNTSIEYLNSLSRGGELKTGNGIYRVDEPILLMPKASLVFDTHATIKASEEMDVMMTTGVGNANRVKDIRIKGGRWDLNSLARRAWHLREYQRVRISDIFMRGSAPQYSVDGSYIELGDDAQDLTGYEFILDNFWMYQNDLGGAPWEVPEGFMGIRSMGGAGSSDMHITNGVICGVKKGLYGKFAAGKIGEVHVWNYDPTQGHLENGFHFTDYWCSLYKCQVDTYTNVVAYKFEGLGVSVYSMEGCEVNLNGGRLNTGHAVEIGAGVKLNAKGNNIRAAGDAKYATDFGGDTGKLFSTANVGNGVVNPCKWEGNDYTVRTKADLLDVGTTFTNVAGLALPMAASTTYDFEFHLSMDADATGTGIDVTLNGPAGVISLNAVARIWTSGTTYEDKPINSYLTASSTSGDSNGTSRRDFLIRGTVRNGLTPGYLVPMVRREAVGSGPNVRTYSWGRLTRIDRVITDTATAPVWDFTLSELLPMGAALTRASTGTRISGADKIETKAIDAPRFQYQDGVRRGLLIEPARTNLNPRLKASTSTWTALGGATGANLTDNALNYFPGMTVTSNGSVSDYYRTPNTISLSSGVTYAGRVRYRPGTSGKIRIAIAVPGAGNSIINGVAGAVAVTLSAGGTTTILRQYQIGSMYVVEFTIVPGATSASCYIALGPETATVGQNVAIYAAQIEAGDTCTSDIDTTGSTVARSADVAGISGVDFSGWWNASAGTLIVTAVSPGVGTKFICQVDNETNSNRMYLYTLGTSLLAVVIAGGVTYANVAVGTITPNEPFTAAFAFDATEVRTCLDGVMGGTDSSVTLPTVNNLKFGANTTQSYNVIIGRLLTDPTKLSDAELQALTA